MSLARKLLMFLVLALIPLVIAGLLAVRAVDEAVSSEVRSNLLTTVELEAGRIDQELDVVVSRVEAIAEQDQLVSAAMNSGADRATRLEAAAAIALDGGGLGSGMASIGIHGLDGLVGTAGEPNAIDSTADPEFFAAALGGVVFGNTRQLEDGRRLLTVAGPIRSDDTVVGVLLVEQDIDGIAHQLGIHRQVGKTQEANLAQVFENGEIEYISPLRFSPGAEFNDRISGMDRSQPIVRAFSADEATAFEGADYRRATTFVAARRIPRANWALLVKVDKAEALAGVAQVRSTLLIGFGAVGFGILSISGITLRSFGKRLHKIRNATEAIAAGSLDSRIRDQSSDEIGVLATALDMMAADLSEDRRLRGRAESLLFHRAHHDHLTGLPNRTRFMLELEQRLESDGPGTIAVLFCDLDGFKAVNDGLGHAVGDRLIQTVARRFAETIGPSHLLTRFGGDEFVIMYRLHPQLPPAETLAEALQANLNQPIALDGAEIRVGVSIGIAQAETHHTAELLIRDADIAMYQAKERGKSIVVRADPAIVARANNRLSEASELRQAIEQNELRLLYQPFVALRDPRRVTGCEALVRWQHPKRGLLGPGKFMSAIEASGLGNMLGLWTTQEGCRQLAAWRASGLVDETFAMSVNITTSHLADPTLPAVVARLLVEHQIPPRSLQLEITEHALTGDTRVIEKSLRDLSDIGVKLAIDDFGTENSNLDRLRRFPVHVVKIDRSFVIDIATDPVDRAITQSIVSVASALHLKVVAEGIETEEQGRELTRFGVHDGQGFLYATPMTSTDMGDLLTRTMAELGVRAGAIAEPSARLAEVAGWAR